MKDRRLLQIAPAVLAVALVVTTAAFLTLSLDRFDGFLGLWDPGDDRINPHPAAPVAVYVMPIAVWGIDVNTSTGTLVFTLSDAEVAAYGVPVGAPVLLAQSVNPHTLQPIALYRMPTGAFQLNTYYWDGKPYIVEWYPGETGVGILAW